MSFQRGSPESAGISSQAILDLLEAAEDLGPRQELHSLMVLRKGVVIAEGWWKPYRASDPHILHSVSKSFLSTAIGIAEGEGLFSLNDKVVSLFPELAPPEVSEHLAAMTLEHLLMMGSGQSSEPFGRHGDQDANWVQEFLAHPVDYQPGTRFFYNSMASFMLSAILQKVAGCTTLEYLQPRLFEPLGIREAAWDVNPQGIVVGGWGLMLCTESIAKLGVLYLNDGMWDGKRLLPVGWVQRSTTKHIENGPSDSPDWAAGYCYQFWRCVPDCYRADGALGQLCVVIPQHEMVVAMTGHVDSIQESLNLIWNHLLNSAGPEALPEDPTVLDKLKAKLQSLEIAKLAPQAPESARIEVESGRFIDESHGSAVEIRFAGSTCHLNLDIDGDGHEIEAGLHEWKTGHTTFENHRDQPVAVNAEWTGESTLTIRLQYLYEPARLTLNFVFDQKNLRIDLHRERFPEYLQTTIFEGTKVGATPEVEA